MDSVAFSDGAQVFHRKHSWIVGLDVGALDFSALPELLCGGRLLQADMSTIVLPSALTGVTRSDYSCSLGSSGISFLRQNMAFSGFLSFYHVRSGGGF